MSDEISGEQAYENVYREGHGGHRNSRYRSFVMRYTVIDGRGSVSFIGPCTGLKALVASCANGPITVEDLMRGAGEFDPDLRDHVLHGLSVFDEHNTPEQFTTIHEQLKSENAKTSPVFRVMDPITREASLRPFKAGLVLFNLKQQRIVQVQNTYAEVRREDRGRVRHAGRPTGQFYDYELPPNWQIVP